MNTASDTKYNRWVNYYRAVGLGAALTFRIVTSGRLYLPAQEHPELPRVTLKERYKLGNQLRMLKKATALLYEHRGLYFVHFKGFSQAFL